MKKALAGYFTHNITFAERYAVIHDCGFDSTMLLWGNSPQGEDKTTQINLCRKNKLFIDNIHADYHDINQLWEQDGIVHNQLIQCVIDCHNYGVDTAIVHLSSGNSPPHFSDVGLTRLAKLVNTATKYNIKLAFENLRKPQYNKYVYDHFDSPLVGLCYDVGHNNIYCKGYDVVQYLARPIFATHLHDNNGLYDGHTIPLTGTVDWDKAMDTLLLNDIHNINIESRNNENIDNVIFASQAMLSARKLESMLLAKQHQRASSLHPTQQNSRRQP